MELTKFGHACVRLQEGERTIVIDPGTFTDPSAVDGASDIFITHEHPDHYSEENIKRALAANPELQIWTNSAVAEMMGGQAPRVHVVGHGDAFTAAEFDVHVYGEHHAVIHPDIPVIKNIGFLVDGKVFHPGDAFTVPEEPVETLLLPAHAPWSKLSEIIDYVRETKAPTAYAIHDGLLNDIGLGMVGNQVGKLTSTDYTRLTPTQSAHIH